MSNPGNSIINVTLVLSLAVVVVVVVVVLHLKLEIGLLWVTSAIFLYSSHWPSLKPSTLTRTNEWMRSDHLDHIKTKDQEDIDFHLQEFSSLNLNHHRHETEPQQLLGYVIALACCWLTQTQPLTHRWRDVISIMHTWIHVSMSIQPRSIGSLYKPHSCAHARKRKRRSVDSCSCKSCKEPAWQHNKHKHKSFVTLTVTDSNRQNRHRHQWHPNVWGLSWAVPPTPVTDYTSSSSSSSRLVHPTLWSQYDKGRLVLVCSNWCWCYDSSEWYNKCPL